MNVRVVPFDPRTLLVVFTLVLASMQSARADSVAVGTDLSPCVVDATSSCAYADILPGQILAQSFVLNGTITVSDIFVVIGEYAVPIDPSNPVQTDYGNLTFNLQLTNSLGPGTTPGNVISTSDSTFLTSGPQSAVVDFPVDQVLSAGTYYLVASTDTPIPNSSMMLGWGVATDYAANAGPALYAPEGVYSIWEAMQGCFLSGCGADGFAPASTFIPTTYVGPYEFQVCSEDGGTGCGEVAPPQGGSGVVPELPSFFFFLSGICFTLPLLSRFRARAQEAQ